MPAPRKKEDLPLLKKLGANIRAAREKAGLTQEELAELADIHPRALQKIEGAGTNLQSLTLIRIQAALGCPWDSIIPKVGR
ncbi:helix-turn-helix domain-containing protein [Oleiharenicola lentus]|uniref:helix-turn-helix domain-containing protein n=1 Tax=Oleiharenicola lentus TaxID=2508720 RepID=UPI003F66EDA4